MLDLQHIRNLALTMGYYRFAQGQARERGDNDKADEYAAEADKAWRELCRATEPALGVPAFDATQPCQLRSLTPGQVVPTMCPRCKNPHHACDGGGVLEGAVRQGLPENAHNSVKPAAGVPASDGGQPK